MINSITLNELSEIINSINENSLTIEKLNTLTDNSELLLNILSSVNKTNIKKYTSKHSRPKQESKQSYEYTKEQVYEFIFSNNRDEILKSTTKEQLVEMHLTIYNVKPLSSMNKEKILQEIIDWFLYAERNRALSQL